MSIRRTLTGLLAGVAIAGMATVALAQATYVREAQQHLIELGYAPGTADGYVGPATRDAISAFQRDNQLPVTGVLDDLTLRSIRDSVINQTLFGGTVTLEFDRPEPEIVPLNPDGTATATASPKSISPPAAGAGTGSSNAPDVGAAPDAADVVAEQPSLPEQFDAPGEPLLSQQPRVDSDVAASEALAEEGPTFEDVPAGGAARVETFESVMPDTVGLPSLDLSDLASDGDALPQPDLDNEPALPPVDLDPVAQAEGPGLQPQPDILAETEPVAEPAPTSVELVAESETVLQQEAPGNTGMAAPIIDRAVSWMWEAGNWAVGAALLVVVALVWFIGRRLLGPSEPRRVAMTRAQYMASGGAERARPTFRVGENQAAADRDVAVDDGAGNRPERDSFYDDEAAKPPMRSREPASAAGARPSPVRIGAFGPEPELSNDDGQEPRRGADSRPETGPAPLSSHQPRKRTVASGDAARPVARFSDHRQAQPPRIVRSTEPSAVAAEDGTAAASPTRPRLHAVTLQRIGSGDSGEIVTRRGREGRGAAATATGSGTSDGRLVRPVRPRREEA